MSPWLPTALTSDINRDLAAMAQCAEHLIEKLKAFEPIDDSSDAGLAPLRMALILVRGYLVNLTQGESTVEERQRAHARALKMFEGMRDYLEKIGEISPHSRKIH